MFRARHEGSTKCHTASRSNFFLARCAHPTLKSPACTPLHLARMLQINQVSWACSDPPKGRHRIVSALLLAPNKRSVSLQTFKIQHPTTHGTQDAQFDRGTSDPPSYDPPSYIRSHTLYMLLHLYYCSWFPCRRSRWCMLLRPGSSPCARAPCAQAPPLHAGRPRLS